MDNLNWEDAQTFLAVADSGSLLIISMSSE